MATYHWSVGLIWSLLLCLLRWGDSICQKRASNCPANILKYVWNRPWDSFNSSVRRWNSFPPSRLCLRGYTQKLSGLSCEVLTQTFCLFVLFFHFPSGVWRPEEFHECAPKSVPLVSHCLFRRLHRRGCVYENPNAQGRWLCASLEKTRTMTSSGTEHRAHGEVEVALFPSKAASGQRSPFRNVAVVSSTCPFIRPCCLHSPGAYRWSAPRGRYLRTAPFDR